jgi:hypothetical protein
MMEAARTSETSVDIQLRTRQYFPEDSELHTRRRENLKSHTVLLDRAVSFKNSIHISLVRLTVNFHLYRQAPSQTTFQTTQKQTSKQELKQYSSTFYFYLPVKTFVSL